MRTAIAGLCSAALLTACADAPVPDPRPDILVVLIDDLGYGDLGCYGHPVIETPRIDRLASEGARLTQCYAGAPNCSPARAALLTGRMPQRSGVYDAIATPGDIRLAEDEVTIAEVLGASGYDTCHVGKWHLNQPGVGDARAPGRVHGFDDSTDTSTSLTERMRVDEAVDHVIEWIDGRDHPERPYFAFVSLYEVHHPIPPKVDAEYSALYATPEARAAARTVPLGGVPRTKSKPRERKLYYGCVSQVDSACGRLLDYLEREGREERTLVFVTSDNGPEARRECSWGSPGALRGAKSRVHEGGIRVPGIVRWPGRIPASTTVDTPVSHLDLLATLCGLAETAPPADRVMDGIDVLPALAGGQVVRSSPLYWQHWCAAGGAQVALRAGDWKLLAETEPLVPGRSVLEQLRSARLLRFELYDLAQDPGESHDLSQEQSDRVAELRDELERVRSEAFAEGPEWNLEELRIKAGQAWPETDPGPRTDGGDASVNDDD